MVDLASLVRAGAILPVKAKLPADERCGEVVAHSYVHPALQGRTVVRLSVSDVVPGTDAEMDALGFERTEVVEKLGQQKFRALGFPGWALVNDPARASFALEVTREFKKAKKRVRSKPGHARDAFAAIAEQLGRSVPHFLPSFWEEAGRAFLEEDSDTFAAQCFEKARLVEKEHKLPIDEDVRSAVYLEFALGGAVAAKSLAGYAKELEKRYGAAAAYARYRELALRRTLGGLPPWTGMGKELSSLAKAAKLDVAKEEIAFVSEVLGSPAIKRAPADFWQCYRSALVKLAKSDRNARVRLRHLFPTPSSGGSGFSKTWLEFLEEASLVDALLTQSEEEPNADAAAKWLHELIVFREGDASLLPYLDRFCSRLREAKVPLDISHGWQISLSLAEHAAALGIELVENDRASLSLAVIDCDPVHVAAHPALRRLLIEAVADAIGGVAFETAARGKQGFLEARRAWLSQEIDKLERGSLVSFQEALDTLSKKSTAQLFVEFPEHYARLCATKLAPVLARTLRGGLFAEFTWPAWEEAVQELGATAPQVSGLFPYPLLSNGVKAIVVSGQRRLAEHDFAIPAGGKLTSVRWIDGQFLVVLHTREGNRAYWSADPTNLFEFDSYLFSYGGDLDTTVAAADGGFVTLRGTVHAGARKLDTGSVYCDGQTFWRAWWMGGSFQFVEIDPKTGQQGRASWPAFAVPLSERSDGLHLHEIWLAPLPEGAERTPLGHRDGVCGFATRTGDHSRREVTGVDGRSASAPISFEALALFPGDEKPRLLHAQRLWQRGEVHYGVSLFDPDGLPLGTYGATPHATYGFGEGPPLSCWHFFTPRDEAGSKSLRKTTEAQAEALLGADEADARRLVEAQFPAVTASALRESLLATALQATHLQRELQRLVAERAPERAGEMEEGVLSDAELNEALGSLSESQWSRSPWTPEVNAAARFLSGAEGSVPEPSQHAWLAWLPKLRAFAVLASLPFTPPGVRLTLRRMLLTLRRSGLYEDMQTLRFVSAHCQKGSPFVQANATSMFKVFAGNPCFVRVLDVYEDPTPLGILARVKNTELALPAELSIDSTLRLERNDAEWLDRFLALPERDDFDDALGKELIVSGITGLTRAESALLLFAVTKIARYGTEPLAKELREKLDLKVADMKVANESFRHISADAWLDLLDSAAPEDPAELTDSEALARHLANAWVRKYGKRVSLREELVVTLERELDPPVKSADLLTAALDPAKSPLLKFEESSVSELFTWQQPTDQFLGPAIRGIAHLIAWGFGSLPVGDEYRNGLVELHARTLEGLANPKFALPLEGSYADLKGGENLQRLFDALGGELSDGTDDDSKYSERDTGLLVARLMANTYSVRLHTALRVSRCAALEAERILWQLDSGTGTSALSSAAFLRGAACARLIARIRSTPVPAGSYENNPTLSAPESAARLRQKFDLSANAAQLYLQLLALAEPTNKNIALWNGWKPAELKRSGAELLAKKLVAEGKRERAGRELFLPGGWEKGVGKALPMEVWKKPLYALPHGAFSRTLPPVAAHELFEAAVTRIERGDVPKFEEV